MKLIGSQHMQCQVLLRSPRIAVHLGGVVGYALETRCHFN